LGASPKFTAVEELLDEADSSIAALEFVGETGIGKTTVWQQAVCRSASTDNRARAKCRG
jgi:RecA/RadA recombinase